LKILVYGYGNPGRQDDGLGVEFSARLEARVQDKEGIGWKFDSNYQLNIEDAEAVAENDVVVFADATIEDIDDFCISIVDGKSEVSFTTHSASPGYIVHLCEQLFNRKPVVYLVHIKGHNWEFSEGLSGEAEMNLVKALKFFDQVMDQPEKLMDSKIFETKLCSKSSKSE
jgi:hydrogenase maturation protease